MKLICSKSNLLSGVQIVSKAVPNKTTMSILECILIDARRSEIKLTANDMELGIDIQQMRPYQRKLAERFYHEREYQRLCEAEDEESRRKQFYQMWAAKESYVKLTGRGIGAGIDRYLTDENYRQITDETQSQSAFLKIYDMDTDYVVSACSYSNAFPQQLTIVEDGIMMRA